MASSHALWFLDESSNVLLYILYHGTRNVVDTENERA